MGGTWDQFVLLSWKNWLIQSRKPVATFLEIFLPVFLSLILISFRQLVEVETYTEPTTWRPFNPDYFRSDLIAPSPPGDPTENGTWTMCYTPDLPIVTSVMEQAAERIGINVTSEKNCY